MIFADAALARRLELAFTLETAEYANMLARLDLRPEATVEPIADGYAVYTANDLPINRAGYLGMTGPVSEADLDRVEEFYTSRGLPPELNICPFTDPGLVKMLGQRGYYPSLFLNTLILDLTTAKFDLTIPANMTIEQVGPELRDTWIAATGGGFNNGGLSSGNLDVNTVLMKVAINRTDSVGYLGRINGEAAGGGMVGLRDGLATLYSASTLTEYRGQGLQNALIAARLAYAQQHGCDLALTMTIAGIASQRNMERNGFRIVYTRLTMRKG